MKNIVYTQKGMWKFYHDEKLGLCFYEPGCTTPMILYDKAAPDFDADCDEKGCIYVICQDDKNNIYLLYFDRKKWNRQCILESKSVVPYEKNFTLISLNGWINVFYTIRHAGQYLLIHHILNNQGEPQVIETSEHQIIYSIASDSKNNIYCVYEKNGIGFQLYSWQKKEWQSFKTLSALTGELYSLQTITDNRDALQIVCCTRVKQDYRVYYINAAGVQEILSGISVNPEPTIFYCSEYYILFHLGGRLLQTTSKNPEEGFTKPTYYFPGSFSPHRLFKISSVKNLRQKGIFAKYIYGSELRGDRFEAAIIGDLIHEIDFSLPTQITEKSNEIEEYIHEIAGFENEVAQLEERKNESEDISLLAERMEALEKRVYQLEQDNKKQ